MIETGVSERMARRVFLGASTLALGTTGLLSTVTVSAASSTKESKNDVAILQQALAIEHEGIAAYQLAGASGLLKPDTLKVALVFQGHHKQHRDALEKIISDAGGKPVQPKTDAEYTRILKLSDLKNEGDVVKLATRLELGATNAYLGQVAALSDHKLIHLFTQLCSDEAVHWTTLNNAAGTPIPTKAFIFG